MQKRKKTGFSINVDYGLVVLLFLALMTSFLLLRKFSKFQRDIIDTNTRNLETLRNEFNSAKNDLLAIVNSGLRHDSTLSGVTNSVDSSAYNRVPTNHFDNVVSSVVFALRPLPSPLRIVRNGVYYVTDGYNHYKVGEVSPIGLITNITKGVVYSDLATYSYIVDVRQFSNVEKNTEKPSKKDN